MRVRTLGVTIGVLLAVGVAPAQAVDLSPTVVSITFDDGYAATSVGLDVMKDLGLRGTLYVNSQRVGEPKFFTRAQLKTYQDAGFEIGSHSLNHEDLGTLTPEAAKDNLCADRTSLMNLGFKVTSVAYPFGSYNAAIQQAARDCGFNSGRDVSGLRATTSCANCATAESIPPADPYGIRTSSTVRITDTVAQMQELVTRVESTGGGWLPLVFHHICDACVTNAITSADFTTFVTWLKDRPTTTTVKTVHEVVGGEVKPSPGVVDPTPDPKTVTIGTKERAIDGINVIRLKDKLVLYTPAKGATTGTNQYGYEAAVSAAGVVTQVGSAGNMAIPAGGSVLSGHGLSATWLKANAKLGVTVVFDTPPPPPPPPSSVEYPKTLVTIGANSLAVTGVDKTRTAGALIVYTPDFGGSTGTNPYGFEATVVDGKVVKIENGVGNMPIPENGYVLSGHGTARTWLLANALVGNVVVPS